MLENVGEEHDSDSEAILRYCKLTPCVTNIKCWNTKEDKGKSMIHALYTAVDEKDEATLSSEEIKPIPLFIVELRWAESIS